MGEKGTKWHFVHYLRVKMPTDVVKVGSLFQLLEWLHTEPTPTGSVHGWRRKKVGPVMFRDALNSCEVVTFFLPRIM